MPRAPYVEDTGDWTALGLKKAIEHAVENGHDSIAWTTGAQQADRYNLAKQIDQLYYNPVTKELQAHKGLNTVLERQGVEPEHLEDLVGKDAAAKLNTMPPNWTNTHPEGRILEGLDLEVGGEGMRGYYDQIVPQTANDILKSMGVTERVKPIGVQLHPNQIASQYESMELTGRNPGDIIKPANISEQMGFQITPEIRDYVMNQGLPAFGKGGIFKAVGKGLRGMAERYRLAHEAAQKNAVELLGLPPGNTAMDRAKAMGYDTKVYRGTGSDERVARKSSGHEHGIEGISTTTDPRYASMHGNNVMPLLAKSGNVEDYFDLINNFENKTGRSFSDASERLFTDAVKGEGVRASALHDPNAGLDIRYLYPEDLRSVNAAFDPAHAKSPDLLKARGGSVHMAGGGVVHMDNGGLWEGYGAPVERDTQKRQSAYYPQQEQTVRVTPSGAYRESADGDVDVSEYTMGADIDILNKYGFGVTKQGQVVKLPERSYTFDDGYTETQPARKIKHSDISELRARYTTDDGVQYGVVRQPLAKGWSGYRSDPRSQSSVGVNVSPYYKGINYTKNFAKGGEVDADSVDYDELYEFKDYGNRETGEPKDTGALGEIRMPNGRDVMTEYSINVDGREMPSIVEGMHPADVNYIRETGIVPRDAQAVAVRSANKREASGQSPFWNRKDTPAFAHGGEVDYDKHYEFIQPAFAHGGEVDYDSMYEFR